MIIAGFWIVFIVLLIASMIPLYPTMLLWSVGRRSMKLDLLATLKALDFRGKSKDFLVCFWNYGYQ